ncbi:MAG: DNA polymerase III subunit beta, partial [Alkalispirochaetaceae bacterium]
TVAVDVQEQGTTTVFCDKFLGILRTLPSGEIEFEQKSGDNFVIRPMFKKIDFRLKSIAADKYPEIQVAADESYFDVPQEDLIEMISQTVFAVSDDETRYFMNGVYLEQLEQSLVMVATDGRRLSYINKELKSTPPGFNGVIIPPKVLTLVRKLASGEGPFSIAVTDKHVFFRFDNKRLSSALIEGQFPNYQRVIPESQEHELVIKKGELEEALKRVSLLVEKSKRIYLNLSQDYMELKSEETEIGIASEEIGCTYQGPEVTIALNYLYLVEPLRVIDSEQISFNFTEPNKAITIYSIPKEHYFHIVMPMQLD